MFVSLPGCKGDHRNLSWTLIKDLLWCLIICFMFDLIERHAVVFDYMVYVQFDRKTCCGAIDGVWLKKDWCCNCRAFCNIILIFLLCNHEYWNWQKYNFDVTNIGDWKIRNLVDTNYTNTSCIEHSAPGHRLFSANGGEKRSWGKNTWHVFRLIFDWMWAAI